MAGEKWEGVRREYWVLDTYNLPIVRHMDILDLCEGSEDGEGGTPLQAEDEGAEEGPGEHVESSSSSSSSEGEQAPAKRQKA
jgi:hypothetical protein